MERLIIRMVGNGLQMKSGKGQWFFKTGYRAITCGCPNKQPQRVASTPILSIGTPPRPEKRRKIRVHRERKL